MRRIREYIQVLPWSTGVDVDRYGNAAEGYGDPVTVGVYAVAPKQSTEPDETGRRSVLTGLTVYAPDELVISARDRVIVRGEQYEVHGEPGYWQPNPHIAFDGGGVQFDLERSEG